MDSYAFEQRRARRRTSRKRTATGRKRRSTRSPLNPLLVYNRTTRRPRMADKWYMTRAEKIRAGWRKVKVVIRDKKTGKRIAEFDKYVPPKGKSSTFRPYKRSRDAGLAMLGRK